MVRNLIICFSVFLLVTCGGTVLKETTVDMDGIGTDADTDTDSTDDVEAKEEIKLEEYLKPEKETMVSNFTKYEEPLELDEQPQTYWKDDPTIKRIANEIYRWKKNNGAWWECGKVYSDEESITAAYEWSYHMVSAANTISKKDWKMDPDGFKYTAAIESSFDRCALGIGSRHWGIKYRVLKYNKYSISYPKEQVLAVLKDKRHRKKFRASDIGAFQLMHPTYYRGPAEDLLKLGTSMEITAKEMWVRKRLCRNNKPWECWWGYSRERQISRRAKIKRLKKSFELPQRYIESKMI